MIPILANVGLPMLVPQLVMMGFALVPIVLIESLFARRLPGLTWWAAVKGMAYANVCSTLVGIPIAWVAMLALGLTSTGGYALGLDTPLAIVASVTLQAAWLIPYEGHFYWMIPAATMTLLVPSFIASVFIERAWLFKRWSEIDRLLISRWVVRANAYSYLILLVLSCTWFTLEVASRPLGERLPKKQLTTQPSQSPN